MKTTTISELVPLRDFRSPPKLPKYRLALQTKRSMMSRNEFRSNANLSSRRVSLDMSNGSGRLRTTPPMNPNNNRSSSYGPPVTNGFGSPLGNDMDGPILPIPPVSCIPPMPFGRRSSAPGFYCRQEPLAPALSSPHMPGMTFMPTQHNPANRRASHAPAGQLMNQGQNTSPITPPTMRQRAFINAHHNSFDGTLPPHPPIPVDPFDSIYPSHHVGLAAELDATVDEVIAANGPPEGFQQTPPLAVSDGSGKTQKKKPRVQTVVSFPVKLYEILMDKKYSEYVTWLPHGRAWRILKQKSFEKEVIPKHFRSARYASFMRQVNGWGFKRITEGPDLNAYYHESFLRGLPELVAEMRRPQKGELPIRKPRGFPENPDFYKISSIAPLPAVSPTSSSSSEDSKSSDDIATTSQGSDELAVVSERSTDNRTKGKATLSPSELKKRKNEETDAAAALFFGEVASVGSFFDGSDDHWDQRQMSPGPEPNRSGLTNSLRSSATSSLSGVPRELKIPQNAQSMYPRDHMGIPGHHEDEVLSKADLAYLAQQNRLLLKQARMISGVSPNP